MESPIMKIQMQKTNLLTVKEAFDQFIVKCRVKNLTDHSINSYSSKCQFFINFYGENNYLSNIFSSTIDEYILYLKENSKANDITINSYLRSLRAFLNFCSDYGYINRIKINLLKSEKKIKETYSEYELQVLLKKPNINSCSFSTYKTWCFINYLVGTGNRVSTAIELKVEDIDFDGSTIRLRHTKNRKQQIIPLSYTLSRVLREYLAVRGSERDMYVFCDEYGNKAKLSTYQQLVRRYNIKRGISKTSCHLFRHTFAKYWIINGGDIFRLQKILGHSDLSVTKEYLAMFGQDLQLDFEKFNPLDNVIK